MQRKDLAEPARVSNTMWEVATFENNELGHLAGRAMDISSQLKALKSMVGAAIAEAEKGRTRGIHVVVENHADTEAERKQLVDQLSALENTVQRLLVKSFTR